VIIDSVLSFFKRRSIDEKKLKKAFGSVKGELNEHRDSINENTTEMQELRLMLEKVKEELFELKLAIGCEEDFNPEYTKMNFGEMEKRVFMVLYMSETGMTLDDISMKTDLNNRMLLGYINTLINKGVKIIEQRSLDDKVYFYIDRRFKEFQARRNVMGITESFSQTLVAKNTV